MKSMITALSWFLPGMFGLALLPAQQPPADKAYRTSAPDLEFRWGEIRLPLELWANPYYFRGTIRVRKDQLPGLVAAPLQFYRQSKPVWIRGITPTVHLSQEHRVQDWQDTLSFRPGRLQDPLGSDQVNLDSFVEERSLMFTLESQGYILEHMMEGDEFVFTNFRDRTSGIVINSITVEVENPWEEFTPRFTIPFLRKAKDDLASWQLVQIGDGRSRLRYDPTDTSNVRILKAYADTTKYRLVPVPAFRTQSRYLSFADLIVPPRQVSQVDTLTSGLLDPYDRLEALVDDTRAWHLRWGQVDATALGPYYKPGEFYGRVEGPLLAVLDDLEYPIRQARVSVVPVKGEITQYLVDGRAPESWKGILDAIPSKTSVYFDEVIIEADGRAKLLPLQFFLNLL